MLICIGGQMTQMKGDRCKMKVEVPGFHPVSSYLLAQVRHQCFLAKALSKCLFDKDTTELLSKGRSPRSQKSTVLLGAHSPSISTLGGEFNKVTEESCTCLGVLPKAFTIPGVHTCR